MNNSSILKKCLYLIIANCSEALCNSAFFMHNYSQKLKLFQLPAKKLKNFL